MTHVPISNPGSPRALELGCTCPVLDNSHGEGMPGLNGARWFWFNANCPLHSQGDWTVPVQGDDRD